MFLKGGILLFALLQTLGLAMSHHENKQEDLYREAYFKTGSSHTFKYTKPALLINGSGFYLQDKAIDNVDSSLQKVVKSAGNEKLQGTITYVLDGFKIMDRNSRDNEFQSETGNHPPRAVYWWLGGIGLVSILILSGVLFLPNGKSVRKYFLLWEIKYLSIAPSIAIIDPEDEIVRRHTELNKKIWNHITQGLRRFEADKGFLNGRITLSILVNQLNTNAKYLNYFLKNQLGKDYKTYINDLRIQFIVEKIKNEKPYKQYKISYLAKISGFSSHSAFTQNFKRLMNQSPSQFIRDL